MSLEVRLVNSQNHSIVLAKETVSLTKGRIPLRDLMNKWKIKDPIWLDVRVDRG